jgi:hypothetical protein
MRYAPGMGPLGLVRPPRTARLGARACGGVWALVLGCSSSSAPALPVIDALDVPASAASAPGGLYPVTGTITVHDSGGAKVTRLHLHAPPAADPPDTPFAMPVAQGTLEVMLLFQGTSGTTIPYEVTVFDSNGAESAPVQKSVTLE